MANQAALNIHVYGQYWILQQALTNALHNLYPAPTLNAFPGMAAAHGKVTQINNKIERRQLKIRTTPKLAAGTSSRSQIILAEIKALQTRHTVLRNGLGLP